MWLAGANGVATSGEGGGGVPDRSITAATTALRLACDGLACTCRF
jgi:hypothetical protein